MTSTFVDDFLFDWDFCTVKAVRDPHLVCISDRLKQIDIPVCTSWQWELVILEK